MGLKKHTWSKEEDCLLHEVVSKYGEQGWAQISQSMTGRSGKQCRDRWFNHLRPALKKDAWTLEEDRILFQAQSQLGNCWAKIATLFFPGRTDLAVKNRFYAHLRKQDRKNKRKLKQEENFISTFEPMKRSKHADLQTQVDLLKAKERIYSEILARRALSARKEAIQQHMFRPPAEQNTPAFFADAVEPFSGQSHLPYSNVRMVPAGNIIVPNASLLLELQVLSKMGYLAGLHNCAYMQ